jgi:hypothetical protein
MLNPYTLNLSNKLVTHNAKLSNSLTYYPFHNLNPAYRSICFLLSILRFNLR